MRIISKTVVDIWQTRQVNAEKSEQRKENVHDTYQQINHIMDNIMKATGIVRRIDDLGRVVIPKEIRRTMRIREGDPLEIFTDKDGAVIFKKYSSVGEISVYAERFTDTVSKAIGHIVAVTDKDTVISAGGQGKKELIGKNISAELEKLIEARREYIPADFKEGCPVSQSCTHTVGAFYPINVDGDVVGSVIIPGSPEDNPLNDGDLKIVSVTARLLAGQIGG